MAASGREKNLSTTAAADHGGLEVTKIRFNSCLTFSLRRF